MVARVRQDNPAARYCCDPVIGDVDARRLCAGGRRRVRQGARCSRPPISLRPISSSSTSSPAAQRQTLADARDAIRQIHALGPRVVLVTSLRTEETPDDALDVLASDGNGQFRLRTPLLPIKANGAGDLMAALFFLHHFHTDSAAQAMALRGVVALRHSRPHRRSRRERNAADRGPGRTHQAEPQVPPRAVVRERRRARFHCIDDQAG